MFIILIFRLFYRSMSLYRTAAKFSTGHFITNAANFHACKFQIKLYIPTKNNSFGTVIHKILNKTFLKGQLLSSNLVTASLKPGRRSLKRCVPCRSVCDSAIPTLPRRKWQATFITNILF